MIHALLFVTANNKVIEYMPLFVTDVVNFL